MNDTDCNIKKDLEKVTTELNILKDKYQTLGKAVILFSHNFFKEKNVSLLAEIKKLALTQLYLSHYDNMNKPIICFKCGKQNMEAVQTAKLHQNKEFDIICKDCGTKLNTWCNGVYAPMYKTLIDKIK